MKKLTPKTVNTVCWITLAVGALVALLGANDAPALAVTGIGIMMAGILFRFIFFRCPDCGTYLDRGLPKYCPRCGTKIENDN